MRRRTGNAWLPAQVNIHAEPHADLEITEPGRGVIMGGTETIPFPRMQTHCDTGHNLVIVAFSYRADEEVDLDGVTVGETACDVVAYPGVGDYVGRCVGIAYAFQNLTDPVTQQPVEFTLSDEVNVIAAAQVLRVRHAERFLPPHDSGVIDPTELAVKEQVSVEIDTGASALGGSLVVTTLGCYLTNVAPGPITYASGGKSAPQHSLGFITEGYETIRTNYLATARGSRTVNATFYSAVAGTNHESNVPPDGGAYVAFPFSR